MISCKNLIGNERLGNHLFRYAFLRITARRLGVKFYCPEWIGDTVFSLDDENEREKNLEKITKIYTQPKGQICYSQDVLDIQDGTDIFGYFQSAKYYPDPKEVKRWYTFKEDAVSSAREKYKHIDFSKSVGLHLRLGDWIPGRGQVLHRYIPRFQYYKQALSRIPHKESILIFSDEIDKAGNYFQALKGHIVYVDGNKPYEDLYLMSQCRNFISSPSTLSWWGAWLNSYTDKTIIAPKEGPLRYSKLFKKEALKDYWPEDWIKIRALRPFVDDYRILSLVLRTK